MRTKLSWIERLRIVRAKEAAQLRDESEDTAQRQLKKSAIQLARKAWAIGSKMFWALEPNHRRVRGGRGEKAGAFQSGGLVK
jgi:hypothetical protein